MCYTISTRADVVVLDVVIVIVFWPSGLMTFLEGFVAKSFDWDIFLESDSG